MPVTVPLSPLQRKKQQGLRQERAHQELVEKARQVEEMRCSAVQHNAKFVQAGKYGDMVQGWRQQVEEERRVQKERLQQAKEAVLREKKRVAVEEKEKQQVRGVNEWGRRSCDGEQWQWRWSVLPVNFPFSLFSL